MPGASERYSTRDKCHEERVSAYAKAGSRVDGKSVDGQAAGAKQYHGAAQADIPTVMGLSHFFSSLTDGQRAAAFELAFFALIVLFQLAAVFIPAGTAMGAKDRYR